MSQQAFEAAMEKSFYDELQKRVAEDLAQTKPKGKQIDPEELRRLLENMGIEKRAEAFRTGTPPTMDELQRRLESSGSSPEGARMTVQYAQTHPVVMQRLLKRFFPNE